MQATPKQQKAIDFDQGKCLVAAGAGSGKTKVLTSRVFDLVAKGKAKLSELLILTFTNKAAHDMKEKIRKLFLESPDKNTQALSPEVENAKIMTFDAFALDLVKRYRHELGLEKGIELLEDCFFQVKINELLDAVLDKHYQAALEGKDPEFAKFATFISLKDDDELRKFIKAILDLSKKKSDRRAFLEGGALARFDESYIEKVFADIEAKTRAALRAMHDELSLLGDEELMKKDLQRLDEMLATSTYDELGSFFALSFPQGSRKLNDEEKLARNLAKARYLTPFKGFYSKPKEQWKQEFLSTRPQVELCLSIAAEVDSLLSVWKEEHGVYDFADIALLAKKIVDSKYGDEVKKSFKYVMIDEYQDTSDLQEDFVEALGVPNVFMVGDIKQSIYGFRNANPELFAKKFADYGKGKGGTLLTLDDNFRSREQVLKAINDTFSEIMSEQIGGIDYEKGQALLFGNHSYDASKDASPYGYDVITYQQPAYKKDERIAHILARDILQKMKNGYQVKGEKGMRGIAYGDFAILTRNRASLKNYEKVFRSLNIPVQVYAEGDAFDEDVMIAMSTLVEWVARVSEGSLTSNALSHYCVCLKRSFLCECSDQDIYFAVKNGIEKDPLCEKVRNFAFSHQNEPLSSLIENLIVEFGFTSALLRLGDVKANFDLLSYFVKLAQSASRLGMGLTEFAAFLQARRAQEIELSFSPSPEPGNAIQLMTIHKSKGLEFHYVYFPSFHSKFRNNYADGAKDGFASLAYDLVLPKIGDNGEAIKTIFHLLVEKERKLGTKSEEMRLLYVALTRAMEGFCVLKAIGKKPTKPKASVADCSSHLSFLEQSSFFSVHAIDGDALPFVPVQFDATLTPKEVKLHDALILSTEAPSSELRPYEELPDAKALRVGIRLHHYMEVVDLKTKDLSFIPRENERALLAKVLALPIFNGMDKKTAYREFTYVDEEDKEHRVDLFFLYDDHIEVIDYKTYSVSKEEYQDQVRGYMAHLEKVFGLPATGYLLSLAKAELIKVE